MPNIESDQSDLFVKAYAHCDGPCGVYDPASARVAGEAVQSMTKKMSKNEKGFVFKFLNID